MKAREDRHKVLIPARLRWRGAWEPASVRNISSRGMMLRIGAPPSPGTYVEIELASRVIAARTVWADGQCCGFQSQDVLDVVQLRSNRGGGAGAERRTEIAAPRPVAAARRDARDMVEHSRRLSALFQFMTLIFVGLGAAFFLGSEVYHALSAPINAVTAQLK